MHLVDDSRLADPIDATDALLDAGGRPRHLEMHNETTAVLEVQSLARSISGEQYCRRPRGELLNGVGALRSCQTAVELAGPEAAQKAAEFSEGVAVFGEDDRRLG